MKKLLIIFLFFSAPIISYSRNNKKISCKLFFNDTIKIKFGEHYFNPNYGFSISFDSVLDSRCFKEVQCIWAGNAKVKFIFNSAKGKKTSCVLDTDHGKKFRNDLLIDGYRIILLDLIPDNSRLIKQKDYEATVIIKKE